MDLISAIVLKEQAEIEKGKFPNPWLDPDFNDCELDLPEPGYGIDDFSERVGGATTTSTTTIEKTEGGCYWTKVGQDLYYMKGGVAVGTSSPRSDAYKFHTEDGHLGAVGAAATEIWSDCVGVW